MALTIYGFRYSVYTRIVNMTVAVRGLTCARVETDPFTQPPDAKLIAVNPFVRVPVLDHDGFVLFETVAITRYLARTFPGVELMPDDPQSAARMDQVLAMIDSYVYWPMVRQVFSHAVFGPLFGEPSDPEQISAGLVAAQPVLQALDCIAAEGRVLSGNDLTLADLHLAPMMGYFTAAPQGKKALGQHPNLARWWDIMEQHPAYCDTDPGLASLAADA